HNRRHEAELLASDGGGGPEGLSCVALEEKAIRQCHFTTWRHEFSHVHFSPPRTFSPDPAAYGCDRHPLRATPPRRTDAEQVQPGRRCEAGTGSCATGTEGTAVVERSLRRGVPRGHRATSRPGDSGRVSASRIPLHVPGREPERNQCVRAPRRTDVREP